MQRNGDKHKRDVYEICGKVYKDKKEKSSETNPLPKDLFNI